MKFSRRIGVDVPQADITVRYDAPSELRGYVSLLMFDSGIRLRDIRALVCRSIKDSEDHNNWSENDYMKDEIRQKIEDCYWSDVYDIIEEFYSKLTDSRKKEGFEQDINDFFFRRGIGWKMLKGSIEIRGEESFEERIASVDAVLQERGLKNSRTEFKEALRDLSRRPIPDLTGAVQHALAGLECVCREISEDKNRTLGELLNQYPDLFPTPLNEALRKIWGYASENARHIKEDKTLSIEEAELVVHLSASLCIYLLKKASAETSTPF